MAIGMQQREFIVSGGSRSLTGRYEIAFLQSRC
jgi:hypothetical protein